MTSVADLGIFTVGDTAPPLTGTCANKVGNMIVPAPITGANLVLHLRKPSRAVLTKTAAIVSGPDGTWSYSWIVGDLDENGTWEVELQVTFAGGAIQTFGPSPFPVKPQIG